MLNNSYLLSRIGGVFLFLLCCFAVSAEEQDKTADLRLYTIGNKHGMTMSVTNYGARIVSLNVPDRSGHFSDIVCGFDSLADYIRNNQNFGSTVGRYIGRILNARFELDGQMHYLQAGGNGHISHGGSPGFANRFWTVLEHHPQRIVLQYISPDGENGFPGTLDLRVQMQLTDDNSLKIDYEATTDKPTVLNPSNHSFFNLSGDFDTTVLDGELWIDADSIAEYTPQKCVTGCFLAVKDSPFDFTSPQVIGLRIDADDDQLKVTGGYDHTWRLNHAGNLSHRAASYWDKKSGRLMEVYTTEPGMHIYTANGLKANLIGKGGIAYKRRSAICFETMHFADSPNKPQFPSTALRPGETFHSCTLFRFKVKE